MGVQLGVCSAFVCLPSDTCAAALCVESIHDQQGSNSVLLHLFECYRPLWIIVIIGCYFLSASSAVGHGRRVLRGVAVRRRATSLRQLDCEALGFSPILQHGHVYFSDRSILTLILSQSLRSFFRFFDMLLLFEPNQRIWRRASRCIASCWQRRSGSSIDQGRRSISSLRAQC